MLINASSTLKNEDFPDQHAWIGKLLQPLNAFMTSVTQAVNGNLVKGENIPSQLLNLQFVYNSQNDFPKNVQWQLPTGVTPVEVRVCSATEDKLPIAVIPAWSFANGTVSFANIYKISQSGVVPLTKGSSYNIVLRGEP